MKRAVLSGIAAVLCAGLSLAAAVDRVTVIEGETSSVEAPFEVVRYVPSNKDVVGIEVIGGTTVRLTGLKRGVCTLTTTGLGGVSQTYEVSVIGNLAQVLDMIQQDLDTLPEVRAEIRGSAIRLDGEISSIAKWEYYTKVVEAHRASVVDFVRFSPGPELVLRLRDLFDGAGFATATNRFETDTATWPFDTVAITRNDEARTISLQAAFLDKDRLAKAESILVSIPWLAKPGAKPQAHAFTLLDEMRVANPIIRLGVAYLAISDAEVSRLGGANPLKVGGHFAYLGDVFRGDNRVTRTSTVQADIESLATFSAQNKIGRISDIAYLAFESWDKDGGMFKSGGTVYFKLAAAMAADLKEVSYGFVVNVKGGLVTEKKTKLSLDIEISKPERSEVGDVDKNEEHTRQTLTCPLGHTLAIGGFGELDDSTDNEGVPFVRHIPIVKWFFGSDNDDVKHRRLVILVSPEIVDIGTVGTLDVDRKVTEPVKTDVEKTPREVEEERKPYSGWLYWLNWFLY